MDGSSATTPVDLWLAAGRERVPYGTGLEWMRRCSEMLRQGAPESVALLEHDPVYTRGARASRDSLRVPEVALPAPLVEVDRGGDVTWHGPGQLVLYPVLDLRRRGLRAGDYVRALEALAIAVLARWEIEGTRIAGRPGVWVCGAKVAAVGVRIDRGVSRHGLSLNVSPDLGWFDAIVPCGIEAPVTSMAVLLDEPPSLAEVAEAMTRTFARAFASTFRATLVDAVTA